MRVTLKEELKKCKGNLRKLLNKRDKWVKDHPGQVIFELHTGNTPGTHRTGETESTRRTGNIGNFELHTGITPRTGNILASQ